ncbi:MAG: SPOR domain-containing protein [Bacteroidales bacterium]|nr:SPOR domain-containing protein [Porphyromonas sp.]MDD6935068.1 SPOR domain-containing protein [Bacteroidales bacterium]MDY3102049.1 SPOR domain-containing protein [Porphyromonas sp.]
MSHQIHKNTKCRNFLKGVALVFLLLLGWYPQRAHAQSAKEYNINDIFEALAQKGNGTGHIELSQPDDIKRLVGSTTQKQTSHGEGRGESTRTARSQQGYRIQAYTGNLAKSKQEAYRRAKIINAANPTLGCYVTYKSPFWRLSVGDFKTKEEAQKAMQELKRSIPDIAPELYIVQDNIRVIN